MFLFVIKQLNKSLNEFCGIFFYFKFPDENPSKISNKIKLFYYYQKSIFTLRSTIFKSLKNPI